MLRIAGFFFILETSACSLIISTDGLSVEGDKKDEEGGNEQPPSTTKSGTLPNPSGTQQRAEEDAGGIAPSSNVTGRCAGTNDPRRLLCEDFNSTGFAGWKLEGQIFLSDGTMLATTGTVNSGDTASEISRDILPTAGDRLRASWSMLNETVNSTCNGANTGAIYYTDGSKYFIVQVQLRKNNALDFQEYGLPGDPQVGRPDYANNAPVSTPTPTGEWARIVMTVDRKAPGGPVASVTVNDKAALKDFKLKGGGAGGLGTPLTKVMFAVGLTYVASPSGPCRVRFDDVMLETF
jgi:hypothetical protein